MHEIPDNETAETAASKGAGERLREAREEKGISTAEVAAQLHLHEQTIIALEHDDKSRLPAPIYVRGYVRAYARLLGLEGADLLKQYQPADAMELKPVGIPQRESKRLRRPLIPWSLLGGLLVVAMAIAAVIFIVPSLWERFSAGSEQGAETTGLPAGSSDTTSSAAEPPEVEPGGVRLPAITPAQPTVTAGEAETESSPPQEEAGPVTEPAPETPVVPEEAETPAPVPEPAPADVAEERQLRLVLDQDSWISIKDANDRRLLVGLYKAGSRHEVSGAPPLQVVLGNAAGVQLSVDGKAYPLTDYAPGSVARFSIE